MTVDQLVKKLVGLQKRGFGGIEVRIFEWSGEYVSFGAVDAVGLRKKLTASEKERLWVSEDDDKVLTLPFVELG